MSTEDDRTVELPAPAEAGAFEKTAAIPATSASQEEADRRLAQELARRGVPPDEIQRLVALSRGEPATPPAKKSAVPLPVSIEIPQAETYVPNPTITLPEFREPSTQERIEADRLLTAANVARRRGNFRQAEENCRAALQLAPKDAPALELYGDILQAVGRVDDAAYCYLRATEADPRRASAEKKYAEIALLQNRTIDLLRQEFIPRSPLVAVLFSTVFPGAGQFYNGDTAKGLITAAAFVTVVALILWSDLGLPSHRTISLPPSLVTLLIVLAIIYIFAVVDANVSARRGKAPRSGWEV